MCLGEQRRRAPATHVGDPKEGPDSWLHPGPILAAASTSLDLPGPRSPVSPLCGDCLPRSCFLGGDTCTWAVLPSALQEGAVGIQPSPGTHAAVPARARFSPHNKLFHWTHFRVNTNPVILLKPCSQPASTDWPEWRYSLHPPSSCTS